MKLKNITRQTGRQEGTPKLLIQGNWLKEMGFSVGDVVEVEGKDGEMTVKKVPPLTAPTPDGSPAPTASTETPPISSEAILVDEGAQ